MEVRCEGWEMAKKRQKMLYFEKKRVFFVKKCNFAVIYGGEDTDISAS